MGFLRRDKSDKPPSDGPEQWRAKALEIDAHVKQERKEKREELLGDAAVGSDWLADYREHHPGYTPVEELSEAFLKDLYSMGINKGKFIRIGGKIFISPGPRPGFHEQGLLHVEIIDKVMKMPDAQERLLGAEALAGATEAVIGPHGLVDAGMFDTFFLKKDEEPLASGVQGRLKIKGLSSDFGMADDEGRQKTVDIARQQLGTHIRVDSSLF